MKAASLPGRARLAFFSLAALWMALVGSLAMATGSLAILGGASLLGLLLLVAGYRLLSDAEARTAQSDATTAARALELDAIQADRASRNSDFGLLGRFGNLLIGCTDLAETLQVSQQMLSQLLPDTAGTIYPLIGGEGLAEATHLWGTHIGETKAQASADECLCMKEGRLHLAGSLAPETLCPHILLANLELLTAACIPLTAQGESLGWIYLSAPGSGTFPKLQVAIAAADQLALALANLKLRQNLRDLSVRDPLTGLFNRRFLSESLGREISRGKRRGLSVAVLAFDLDRFKNFNDTYGHAAGDDVLVAFAKVLRANSRSEDIACRQGGEEFVLIMPEMNIAVALRRAEALMKSMAALDVVHGGQLLPKLTTSIGLAIFPAHGTSPEKLLAQADIALYEAKAQGRNRVVVATAPPHDPDSGAVEWQRDAVG